jgi:hypothetical protein
MRCLTLMFDGRGLVDESYKDGSGSEHGIYQAYKLALYLYALQATGTYYYGEKDNLFWSQGANDGFHTGYDQAGAYADLPLSTRKRVIFIVTGTALSKAFCSLLA